MSGYIDFHIMDLIEKQINFLDGRMKEHLYWEDSHTVRAAMKATCVMLTLALVELKLLDDLMVGDLLEEDFQDEFNKRMAKQKELFKFMETEE